MDELQKITSLFLVLTCFFSNLVICLDNGLALTPPMGWLDWERFGCTTNCTKYPDKCICEKLFMTMADLMVSEGYLAAGYEYVIIDDCWLDKKRDKNGRLQPDPERFPSGIKALADYIHSKGLKFGIYEDYGTHTCAGYPGLLGHLEIDAQTFADWEVDYIKVDGCYIDYHKMDEGYPEFGRYLNKTKRPMVYSCSWPAYQEMHKMHSNYQALAATCNLWRNYYDISDSWSSVINIASWYAKNQDRFAPYSGPGHWNDPDMLIIGNFGLNYDQSKVQMALWSIMASPLIMSNDLRSIKPEFKEILQNSAAIKINQDPLGKQGLYTTTINNIDVWIKPILPLINKEHSYAIAFVNTHKNKTSTKIDVNLSSLGLKNPHGYRIQNVFDNVKPFDVPHDGKLVYEVNPTGTVFITASVKSKTE